MLITLWNGPENSQSSLPFETPVSPSRPHSVIIPNPLKNKQHGSPHRCLVFLQTFGDANLGESFLVNETFGMTRACPPKRQSLEVPIKKALASRVSSPSPPSTSTTSRSRPSGERISGGQPCPLAAASMPSLSIDRGRLL